MPERNDGIGAQDPANTAPGRKTDALAGVALAAGLGTRLRPLTNVRPKASLPFGPEQRLIDVALARIAPVVQTVALTISKSSESLASLVPADVHVINEGRLPIGTTLGVVNAQGEIGGDVLMTTTDTWYSEPLDEFVSTWDRERIRLLMTLDLYRNDYLSTWRFTGNALIPAAALQGVESRRGDIVADLFDRHFDSGSLDLWLGRGQFIDCGTPHDLWAGNMIASRGSNVIEGGESVGADVSQSVVLKGAAVALDESIHRSIVGPGFHWRVPDGTP